MWKCIKYFSVLHNYTKSVKKCLIKSFLFYLYDYLFMNKKNSLFIMKKLLVVFGMLAMMSCGNFTEGGTASDSTAVDSVVESTVVVDSLVPDTVVVDSVLAE